MIIVNQYCTSTDHELMVVPSVSGETYQICVPYSYVSTGLVRVKVYAYPDRVDIDDGYLMKVSSNPIKYEYVFSPFNKDFDMTKKNGNGNLILKKDNQSKFEKDKAANGTDNQIIEGVDNKVILIAAIALILLLKN